MKNASEFLPCRDVMDVLRIKHCDSRFWSELNWPWTLDPGPWTLDPGTETHPLWFSQPLWFQEDNGLPVHIKGGTSDVVLYRATMILSGIGERMPQLFIRGWGCFGFNNKRDYFQDAKEVFLQLISSYYKTLAWAQLFPTAKSLPSPLQSRWHI